MESFYLPYSAEYKPDDNFHGFGESDWYTEYIAKANAAEMNYTGLTSTGSLAGAGSGHKEGESYGGSTSASASASTFSTTTDPTTSSSDPSPYYHAHKRISISEDSTEGTSDARILRELLDGTHSIFTSTTTPGSASSTPLTSEENKEFDLSEISYELYASSPLTAVKENLERDVLSLLSPGVFIEVLDDPRARSTFREWLSTENKAHLLDFWLESQRYVSAIHYCQLMTKQINENFLDASNEEKNIYSDKIKSIKELKKPSVTDEFVKIKQQVFNSLFSNEFPRYIRDKIQSYASKRLSERVHELQGASVFRGVEGLGECFCLSDPSRRDNPICLASQSFLEVTGYSKTEVIGRNCRFLQGPATNPEAVQRLRRALNEGVEHTELLLNYRKDGVPFFNLLFMAPLRDEIGGQVKYFLGGQVNVTATLFPSKKFLFFLNEDEESSSAFEKEVAEGRNNPLQQVKDLSKSGDYDLEIGSTLKKFAKLYDSPATPNTTEHKRASRGDRKQHYPVSGGKYKKRYAMPDADESEELAPKGSIAWEQSLQELSDVLYRYLVIDAKGYIIRFASPTMLASTSAFSGLLHRSFLELIHPSNPPLITKGFRKCLQSGRAVTAQLILSLNDEAETKWVHATPLYGLDNAPIQWVFLV